MMPGLSHLVRDHRLGRMRSFMRGQGLDALAFTGADWFEWASNHGVSELAWERPFLLVVPIEGAAFAFMADHGRHHVAAEAERGSIWVDDVTFYAESPRMDGRGWLAPQWRDMVSGHLQGLGLSRARIGVDAVSGPLAAAAALLPELKLIPGGAAMRSLRWVKHAEEIDTMRQAASVSDWAMDAYREEMRPGRLLAEMDHAVAARLSGEAARRLAGENFVIGKLVTLSGAASASPHGDGAPCGKVLERDSVAISTVATRLNGMAMELARTWLVGHPGARHEALFDCARAAQEAGIANAVAGRSVAAIDGAAQAVIARAGFADHLLHRGGHGIGVTMHDFPEDVPFNPRPLLENEVYAVEPGLYVPGLGGFRFADTVVVGEHEPSRLTLAGKDRAAQTIGRT
jgi:Xaa-Pro aminopeptidase